MNIFDVILKRHRGSSQGNVCIFYDENKALTVKKMGEYVNENGFTIAEKGGRFSIADVILRERKPTGEVIDEIPYHKIFDTVTGKLIKSNWHLKGLPWQAIRPGKVIHSKENGILYGALCKLKDYEDTGLSPEEVERLDDFERSQIRVLMKKLAEERKKHRWISVEERLPEHDKMVLVQVSGKPAENITLHDALQLAEYNQGEGWILEAWPEWEEASPVAWMPLPEAYRPED